MMTDSATSLARRKNLCYQPLSLIYGKSWAGTIEMTARQELSPADIAQLDVIKLLERPLTSDMSLDEMRAALSAIEMALKTVDPSMTAGVLKSMAKLRREIDEIERPKP